MPLKVQVLSLIVCSFIVSISTFANDQFPLNIRFSEGCDGQPVWVGITTSDVIAENLDWRFVDSCETSLKIPNFQMRATVVVLKRDAVPIVQELSLTDTEHLLDIEFSKGNSIHGDVLSKIEGTAIVDGRVSLQFGEGLDIPLPEKGWSFSWDIEGDGTFVIHGIPPGEHAVTITSAGFMRAEQLVNLTDLDEQIELGFFLDKAVYVKGRIVEYSNVVADKPNLHGDIGVVLRSPERQSEPFHTNFDANQEFTLGPFPEDVLVELTASLPDGRKSWPVEMLAPSVDAKLEVQRWVRVFGNIQDRLTGKPVSKFKLHTGTAVKEFDTPNGYFTHEIGAWSGDISINAPNYLYWTTTDTDILRTMDEYNLGTVQLERSHTLIGRRSRTGYG